jgi:antitoxin ParD1/3/4
MIELHVQLSEGAGEFVAGEVASGRYTSASDFLSNLVEAARLVAAQERLRQLIDEGENSGEGVEFTDEWWESFTAELRAKARAGLQPENAS